MNNRRNKLFPILLAASMLLSGCADNKPVEAQATTLTEPVAETTVITTEEITTTKEEIKEVPYMEQFKDIITELPPEGYEEQIEGASYSEFKKYT